MANKTKWYSFDFDILLSHTGRSSVCSSERGLGAWSSLAGFIGEEMSRFNWCRRVGGYGGGGCWRWQWMFGSGLAGKEKGVGEGWEDRTVVERVVIDGVSDVDGTIKGFFILIFFFYRTKWLTILGWQVRDVTRKHTF